MKYLKTLALGAAMAVSAGPASAAVAIFTYNQADPGAGLGAGPYGTVTVTEVAGGFLDFSQTLSAGYRIHAGNANHNAFAFKILGDPNVTVSNLTAGFVAISTTSGTSENSPPFGAFFTAIDCTTACSNGFAGGFNGTLSFRVSTASALSLASLGFNTVSGQNVYFTTDVVLINGNTGNVGATRNVTAVPEPATWAMLLLGFGGVGYAMRRRPRTAIRIRYA